MICKCGIAIYVFGNMRIKRFLEGVLKNMRFQKIRLVSLPIKATGGASSKIYETVLGDETVRKDLDTMKLLGQESENVDDIVQATITAVNLLNEEE